MAGPDLVEEVRSLKAQSGDPLRTIGSLSVVKSLLEAGLVDRLRLVVFPQILGETGREPIFAGLPDVDLEPVETDVLDGRLSRSSTAPRTPPDGLSRGARAFPRKRIRPAGGPATIWAPCEVVSLLGPGVQEFDLLPLVGRFDALQRSTKRVNH